MSSWFICSEELYWVWFYILSSGDLKFSDAIKNISSLFYFFLPYTLWSFVIRCIHIKDFYAISIKFTFFHYEMTIFIPDNIPGPKIYFFYDFSPVTSSFIRLVLTLFTFFHSVSSYLNLISYRQHIFGFCFFI